MFYQKLVLITVILFSVLGILAQDETTAEKTTPPLPKPDLADVKYGPYDKNTFDLWKADSKKPAPVVVFIHGGGLASGDKSKFSPTQLQKLHEAGYTVVSVNYRLTGEAVFPQHFMDCARAIQYVRYHAKEYNIDPTRIAAMGSSAGGLTSLWLGFHDDLADPKNADPVLRESTRVKAIIAASAQTTLVPDVVAKYIGPLANQYNSYSNGKMFGLKKEELSTPKALELFKEISPLTYLTKDDPPVWAMYSIPDKPLTDASTTSEAIHHPGFGKVLKEEMDKVGVECKLRHKDDGKPVIPDMIDFLNKHVK